jgi:hypothetical protein
MKKISFGDGLYWLQLVGAVVIGIVQLHHMLSVSTQGLSTSAYLFTTIFVLINLFLALASHRAHPTKITRQTVIIYIAGVAIYSSWLVVLLLSKNPWDSNDFVVTALVSLAVGATAVYAGVKEISLLDPVVKGVSALWMRAIPHLFLAWKLYDQGSTGMSVVTVILFHVLTLSRIFQIFRNRKTAWDRNKTGLAIAEIGNEISWCAVTVAWCGV